MQQFVGIDWATRRARWCAVTPAGLVIDEGWIPADEDGLALLVGRLGPEALACIEMMSGAAGVRERFQAGGWIVQIADARKPARLRRSGRWRPRPTSSTRAYWPSSRGAISCPRCTCRRSPTASSRNDSVDGCIWSGCAPRR